VHQQRNASLPVPAESSGRKNRALSAILAPPESRGTEHHKLAFERSPQSAASPFNAAAIHHIATQTFLCHRHWLIRYAAGVKTRANAETAHPGETVLSIASRQ